MTLISSLYIGASGLSANSTDLSVVGDNIANANTIGFKGSRAAFEDVLGESLIGGGGQLGVGTRLQAVQHMMQQGAIGNTGNATDLAIQGNGFFEVKGQDGQAFFTRAGNFTLDNSGFLVNLEGMRVQGFVADATGKTGSALGDMQLADATSPAKQTENMVLKATLDPGTPPAVPPPAFDINNPSATSDPNAATTMQIVDSLGKEHKVDVYFHNNFDGTWDWHAVTDGGNVDPSTGAVAGQPFEVGTGVMTFNVASNSTLADGSLQSVTGTPMSFAPSGGGAVQAIAINFGDPTGPPPVAPGPTGMAGIIQQAGSPSGMRFTSQDGFPEGSLAGVKIDAQGDVVGTFTNGQTRTLAQLALADPAAPDKMERIGANLYRAKDPAAGDINIGKPGSGNRGTIVAGALEQSNVDIASEFVRMIVAQRSFEANSKTLSTADSLLSELIQLKR